MIACGMQTKLVVVAVNKRGYVAAEASDCSEVMVVEDEL